MLGNICSDHKLVGPHCLCLPSHGSLLQGDPKNQAIQLPDYCNSPRLARDTLVLGPCAALSRDPTSSTSVKNSSQTVSQLCVSQQSTTSQPPHLVARSEQIQEQGFCVEVVERFAAPQRSSTMTIYSSKWALFEKRCRENSVAFSTPSVKQVSDCTRTKRGDLRPWTVIGPPLLTPGAERGLTFRKVPTLTGYSPGFTGIVQQVPGIFPSGTFLLY